MARSTDQYACFVVLSLLPFEAQSFSSAQCSLLWGYRYKNTIGNVVLPDTAHKIHQVVLCHQSITPFLGTCVNVITLRPPKQSSAVNAPMFSELTVTQHIFVPKYIQTERKIQTAENGFISILNFGVSQLRLQKLANS
jgi:hypothetical protein